MILKSLPVLCVSYTGNYFFYVMFLLFAFVAGKKAYFDRRIVVILSDSFICVELESFVPYRIKSNVYRGGKKIFG